MSSAMSAAAVASPMPALPQLGAPSRLSLAFWLALAAEVALVLALLWVMKQKAAVQAPPPAIERVQLVQLPKPVEKPKREVRHRTPAPLRNVFHPRPVPLPPPPVALPPSIPLPPSPIAAAAPPPPPPKVQAPMVTAQVKASYLGEVKSAIQDAVQFPGDARMLRQEGRVRVRFELLGGVISNVQIIAPGQMKSFDSNALLALRNASIPIPPKALGHHLFTLELWVKFHLNRSF